MKNVAEVLGKKEDAARFAEMYDRRKAYFNKTYVNEDGKTMGLLAAPGSFSVLLVQQRNTKRLIHRLPMQ